MDDNDDDDDDYYDIDKLPLTISISGRRRAKNILRGIKLKTIQNYRM